MVGVIALIMVGLATWYLVNFFRRDPDDDAPPARWRSKAVGELMLDGRRTSSTGLFSRRASTRLRAQRVKGRPGAEALVGRLDIHLKAILAWIYAAETRLETSARRVSLHGGGFMDWPWTFVPVIPAYRIAVDGRPFGRFEIGETEIVGRDLSGGEIGRWHTGVRLGAVLEVDEPVYGLLKLPGRATAQLRVPRRRQPGGGRFDFENLPFFRDLNRDDDEVTEIWLLAFATLSAQSSLLLLDRSPDRPKAINA
jgi:hypothetical protein